MEFYRKMTRIYPRLRMAFYQWFNRLDWRLKGAEMGPRFKVRDRAYLTLCPGARLSIGSDFNMLSGDGLNPLGRNLRSKIFLAPGARVTIGNHVGISCSAIRAKESINIGDWVNIGADCIIMDTDAHSLQWQVRCTADDAANAKSAPIVIGDHCLIGARCIILKGVTIGSRTIIAAGSVVTRPIPADCIAAGNPARVIKQLQPPTM